MTKYRNLSPTKIDQLLYSKPILKVALIDNFVERNEGRPLLEYRESVMEASSNFLKAYFADNDKELTQDEIETFEKKYYGTL